MGDELSDVTADISALINKGKVTEAAGLGDRHANDTSANRSSHFWFQYGLARELAGLEGRGQFDRAAMCDDFAPQMQGDLYRDLALVKAREHKWTESHDLLMAAVKIFSGDPNREASVDMFSARIQYLKRNYADANDHHLSAAEWWKQAGDSVDPQWIMNNRFYWLKARARMGYATARLYRELVGSSEPRRDRRVLAWLYHRFGTLGVRLGDLFERFTELYRTATS